MLHMQGVTKVYRTELVETHALRALDLHVRDGEFVAVTGPSGSGKTTFLNIAGLLEEFTGGTYLLDGEDVSRLGDDARSKLRNRKIGFIFQSFNLLPTLTAKQNILLPLDLAGRKPDQAYFDQLIASLGLGDRLEHRPSELSGGQQQRVAVARAMITRPDVIFADEPTGALDSKTSSQLLSYLRNCVRELGQTIIMVTHDPKAAGYADRALLLLDGHIVADLAHPSTETLATAITGMDS